MRLAQHAALVLAVDRRHVRLADLVGRQLSLAAAADAAAVLSSMPPREPVFAMTVHKSQGSQFTHTMLALLTEMSRILTRELIYTAITRSHRTFTLAGMETVRRQSLRRTVVRASTLGVLLWQTD